MRSILHRALAIMLCLCLLLPCLAHAEDDVTGVTFHLQMHMTPEAYDSKIQDMLKGIADLLNIITVDGTLDLSYTGSFDLNADVMLGQAEDTRTSVRLYGIESLWGVESSLFGSQSLMLNLPALLEFAMKAYFHLDVPLQRVALFVTPYVHTGAFEPLLNAWRETMLSQQGSRSISKEHVLALAQQLATLADDDRAFIYWVRAVALEAGYDETIFTFMEGLPAWAESFVGEEGISITAENGAETWATGGVTLFTRFMGESADSWSLNLPETPEGYSLTASYARQNDQQELHLVILDSDKETLLSADLAASALPTALPISAPFSLSIKLGGYAAGDGLNLLFQGEGEGNGYFRIDQVNPSTGESKLSLFGTLNTAEPATAPNFKPHDINGMNIFSANDTTLAELMHNIQDPLLSGMLPLLLRVPASSIQSLLDLVTESGVLGVLTSGSLSGEEEAYDEEEWSEEEWEEEYSEEDWEEEDWDEEYAEEEWDEEDWGEEYEEEEYDFAGVEE